MCPVLACVVVVVLGRLDKQMEEIEARRRAEEEPAFTG